MCDKKIKEMTPEEYKTYQKEKFKKWYDGGGKEKLAVNRKVNIEEKRIKWLESRGYTVTPPKV